MDTKEVNHEFISNGIVLLRDFFSAGEVSKFRTILETEFLKNKKVYIGYDEVGISKELIEKIISKRLSDVLNSIFPKAIMLPDFIIQSGNTPNKIITPHYDCQSYVRQGMSDRLETLKYAKIGVYLQASDKNLPGSIWYCPYSHNKAFHKILWRLPISTRLKNKIDNFYKNFKKSSQIALNCEPGDLVIFDGRLLHSSSPKLTTTPENIEKKIAIYFSVTGSELDAASFMRAETLKFADELTSKDPEYAMRIGYFFSELSNVLSTQCTKVGLKSYSLNSDKIMYSKSKL